MEYNKTVQNRHIDFKKAYDSFRKEVLYNVLIEFGMPMKLVILIKMCLSNTWHTVRLNRHLSNMLFIKNGLKTRDALLLWLFSVAVEYAIKKVKESEEGLNLNAIRHFLV